MGMDFHSLGINRPWGPLMGRAFGLRAGLGPRLGLKLDLKFGLGIGLWALGLGAQPVLAQVATHPVPAPSPQIAPQITPQDEEPVVIQELTVAGRRSGPLVWTLMKGEARVVIVSDISPVPKTAKWDEARIQRLVEDADRVVMPFTIKAGVGDLVAVSTYKRDLVYLPGSTTLWKSLSPEQAERFKQAALKARGSEKEFEKLRPGAASIMLLRRFIKSNGLDHGLDPEAYVAKIASRRGISVRELGSVKLIDLLTGFRALPAQVESNCIDAVIHQVETGPEGPLKAAQDWANGRATRNTFSAVDEAQAKCFRQVPTFAAQDQKAQSRYPAEVKAELDRGGTALMVIPIDKLVRPGGVLDQMHAQGIEVAGPKWRR